MIYFLISNFGLMAPLISAKNNESQKTHSTQSQAIATPHRLGARLAEKGSEKGSKKTLKKA